MSLTLQSLCESKNDGGLPAGFVSGGGISPSHYSNDCRTSRLRRSKVPRHQSYNCSRCIDGRHKRTPADSLESLKRGAVILTITAWESFVEDTAEQHLDYRARERRLVACLANLQPRRERVDREVLKKSPQLINLLIGRALDGNN